MDTMCAGVMAGKGRVPYLIFMLLDVLRAFPGQVRRENTFCRNFRLYLHEVRPITTCPVPSGSPLSCILGASMKWRVRS